LVPKTLTTDNWKVIGAVDGSNLETAPFISILDELEEWEAFLKAEPEVIHKLRAFERAADGLSENAPIPTRKRQRGPSL